MGTKCNRKNKIVKLAHRRAEVSRLYRLEYTQEQIADKLGYSQRTIAEDIKVLNEQYQAQSARDIQIRKGQELHTLQVIEQEALMGYERSLLDKEETVERTETCPSISLANGRVRSGKRVKTTKEKRKRKGVGEAKFLEVALKAVELKSRILGILRPPDVNVNTTIATIDWSTLYNRSTEPDPVEQKIQSLQQLTDRSKVIDVTPLPPSTTPTPPDYTPPPEGNVSDDD